MNRIAKALDKLRTKCTSHGQPQGKSIASILECIAEHYKDEAGAVDSVNGKTGEVVLTGTDIATSEDDETTLDTALAGKQDTLTAGTNIDIDENNVISANSEPNTINITHFFNEMTAPEVLNTIISKNTGAQTIVKYTAYDKSEYVCEALFAYLKAGGNFGWLLLLEVDGATFEDYYGSLHLYQYNYGSLSHKQLKLKSVNKSTILSELGYSEREVEIGGNTMTILVKD